MGESNEGSLPLDKWSIPPGLRSPTASVVSNLIIIMISSEALGNDAIAAIGEFQAEDARFNDWCGSVGMESFPLSEISRRNSEARKLVRRVYEAWTAFSEEFESGRRKIWAAQDERAALLDALVEAKHGLATLREWCSEMVA